jgi:hypothetical protein
VPRHARRPFSALFVAALWLAGAAAVAQDAEPLPDPAPPEEVAPAAPELRFGVEVKAGFRDSEANRLPTPFTIGSQQVFLNTVDPGGGFELANASLFLDATWGDALRGRVKVDLVDLYDRNPTSDDKKVDVDEAWIRYGREADPGMLPDGAGVYVKVGKFGKLERQDDRHLESYGLAATSFNRFEDIGVEVGVDLGRHVYLKASYTAGNPLFLRDPNALAGDNGTEDSLAGRPRLGSGVPLLYDAEVEDTLGRGNEETGVALGLRFASEDMSRRVDLLAWGYHRELAETVPLEGTLYGGDLDVLSGVSPEPTFGPYPGQSGNEKEEVGGNLWVYLGGFSFFGQYVDAEVANLPREAFEAEIAWRFELPVVWSLAGQQLFPSIAPAVRWSKLEPGFTNPARTPAPSLAWEWEKIDAGIRLGITPGTDLTIEYAENKFLTARGWRDNNELLSILRWRM